MNSAIGYSEGAEVPEDKTDNELIAQFMEMKYPDGDVHTHYTFKFDTSWDWIMPVVEKISQIHDSRFKYDLSKVKQGHWPVGNEYMDVIALPLATPINEVHKAVVEFIKYFNSQSQETDKR